MLRLTWRLVALFICGYLLIEWFPIDHPFRLEDVLIQPIINPLEFFAASVAFFFGLIFSAQVIREILKQVFNIFKKKPSWLKLFFCIFGLILTYFFLFQNGLEQSIVLFGFSFLYGMISIEH